MCEQQCDFKKKNNKGKKPHIKSKQHESVRKLTGVCSWVNFRLSTPFGWRKRKNYADIWFFGNVRKKCHKLHYSRRFDFICQLQFQQNSCSNTVWMQNNHAYHGYRDFRFIIVTLFRHQMITLSRCTLYTSTVWKCSLFVHYFLKEPTAIITHEKSRKINIKWLKSINFVFTTFVLEIFKYAIN